MLHCLDQHHQSRPGRTESKDSAEAKPMHSAEYEGLGVNPADRVPIPECTMHQFTTQEHIDAYQAQDQSGTVSVQSRHTDGPPAPQLDQAITENESSWVWLSMGLG